VLRRLARVMSVADLPEGVAICNLIGVVGSAEATPLLAAKLDAAPALASCAAQALKRIGKAADTQLLNAIREGTSARRKVLLPVVTRPWAAHDISACLEDPDPEVRALASDTLARLGNPGVVATLFPLLSDANLRVVHSATAAIQALGSREARELAGEAATVSDNPIVRRSAVRILAYFGDSASLQPLLDRIEDPDPRVREAAVQGLPYLDDPRALEALIAASKSLVGRTRAVAVRSLGHVPHANERVHSLLLKSLFDPEPWVRYYACQSLGRLGYSAGCAEIMKLLDDEAGQVRVAAVEALSHLESPQAHDALRRAASSGDIEVRRAAIVGIGMAHRMDDLPVVLSAASAPDVPTRLVALSAMASFPSPLVLGALSSAASDPEDQVRAAAVSLLAARPEQEATEVLVELLGSEAARDRAKEALLVPSEGRVAGLLGALASARDEMAPILASILARVDPSEVRSSLLSAMKLANPAARRAIATVLAARQDPDMIAALREAAAGDPDAEVRKVCELLLRQ
jgi:HEAT repeat protein